MLVTPNAPTDRQEYAVRLPAALPETSLSIDLYRRLRYLPDAG
jgi:hypothetical protein